MADILKVTTPVLNKNQPVQQNMPTDAPGVLNIQNTSKVLQTHNQTNLSKENSNNLEGSGAPAMLLSLLKDPAVAASYLKNISFLEEIFKLLPANNRSMTAEIEQMFNGMMMTEADIAPEMMRQGESATLLRGELFDFLRHISSSATAKGDTHAAIANFLRAANSLLCRDDIRGAVYNNLIFLRKSLFSSKELSAKIDSLLARLHGMADNGASQSSASSAASVQQAAAEFPELKKEILSFLGDVENSILYNDKIDKVLSILKYNLSRYHGSEEYFHESAFFLRQQLSGPQRRLFASLADRFYNSVQQGQSHPQLKQGLSKVMDALTQILQYQSANERLSAGDEAKIEQILHSLLSSPCNFTPLLHFIVPVEHMGSRAFAEIWVNPNSDEKDMPPGAGRGVHFLLVIDAEGVGRFEADVYVHDRTVDFSLLCPPGLEDIFKQMSKPLAQTFAALEYRPGSLNFGPLERPRSLMEAFKSLPYKRMGLDVKI